MEWIPSDKASTVKLQLPLPSAVVVPSELPLSNNSTVLPASAVPISVGVASLVMLSLLDFPVSELESRSGIDGVVITVSTVRLRAGDGSLVTGDPPDVVVVTVMA